jgi:hypothetical protein
MPGNLASHFHLSNPQPCFSHQLATCINYRGFVAKEFFAAIRVSKPVLNIIWALRITSKSPTKMKTMVVEGALGTGVT